LTKQLDIDEIGFKAHRNTELAHRTESNFFDIQAALEDGWLFDLIFIVVFYLIMFILYLLFFFFLFRPKQKRDF
jgi:hypothetical protein